MRRLAAVLVAMMVAIGPALAQEPPGARRIEVGVFPGGGAFFGRTDEKGQSFRNYALGMWFVVNVNKWIGVENEFGGGIGIRQDLIFNAATLIHQKTPNMFAYNWNLVVSPAGSDRVVVPYVVGGLGGLTVFGDSDGANRRGLTATETYFAGNIGGGVKWFATPHVGLRGDARFIAVKNKDQDQALFFGQQDHRYGGRFYGGVVVTY